MSEQPPNDVPPDGDPVTRPSQSHAQAGPEAHPSSLRADARRRGPRWGVLAGVVAGVTGLAAISAFGLSRDPNAVQPVLLGRQAPDFAARTLDGTRTIRLSQLRGQVVVLNFWSSWCAECRVEHPSLARAWERYRDRGVVVLGMNFDDANGAARSFASGLGIGYPLVTDPGDGTALAFGVTGPPETFLIGADGIVEAKWFGPVGYADLSSRIAMLLTGAAG